MRSGYPPIDKDPELLRQFRAFRRAAKEAHACECATMWANKITDVINRAYQKEGGIHDRLYNWSQNI